MRQAGWSDAVVGGGGHRNDGHVSRNMRLCLYLTDIVEPWVGSSPPPPSERDTPPTPTPPPSPPLPLPPRLCLPARTRCRRP
jgi:hypothetical protein